MHGHPGGQRRAVRHPNDLVQELDAYRRLQRASGSHLELVPELIGKLRAEGVDAPVVVGGIIPEGDRQKLLDGGVAAVYTPKDFELARIMSEIADLAQTHRNA